MQTFNDLSISEATVAALMAIAEYRYLTINQVATITRLKPKSASEMLLHLERQKLLGSFGNTGVRGYGKTPKVYFLKRRGHRLLAAELEAVDCTVPRFQPISIGSRWSPLMYHRIATLDVMSAVERDAAALTNYLLVGTLVEYRREKIGASWRKETTDFVAEQRTPENKIIPDAGFVFENRRSKKRALFLIEVDCGTMRHTTAQAQDEARTMQAKFAQYDRYLASGRVAQRHQRLGQFSGFVLLVITTSHARIANMRAAAASLAPNFHRFYRFSTLTMVGQNLLHDGWLSRDHADQTKYSLIKGN